MSRDISIGEIEKRIHASAYGTMFITADFRDIASCGAANRALQRLAEEGTIRRVLRGIYEYPRYSELLQEYVAPSPDAAAHALARSFGWTIVPCGDIALNSLGLSTQVPAVQLYVSDGPYKTYPFGSGTLQFKHTASRELKRVSYKTALTIQALKTLGEERCSDAMLARIARNLTKQEKQTLLAEAQYTTAWIYDAIKKICK